jgi:hypothetical protein
MHRLDPTGIHLGNYRGREELIPFEDIISLRRMNFLWSIILEFQIWKPVLSSRYMDITANPFRLALLETATARYLIRGGNIDEFIVEAREKIPVYQMLKNVARR